MTRNLLLLFVLTFTVGCTGPTTGDGDDDDVDPTPTPLPAWTTWTGTMTYDIVPPAWAIDADCFSCTGSFDQVGSSSDQAQTCPYCDYVFLVTSTPRPEDQDCLNQTDVQPPGNCREGAFPVIRLDDVSLVNLGVVLKNDGTAQLYRSPGSDLQEPLEYWGSGTIDRSTGAIDFRGGDFAFNWSSISVYVTGQAVLSE